MAINDNEQTWGKNRLSQNFYKEMENILKVPIEVTHLKIH